MEFSFRGILLTCVVMLLCICHGVSKPVFMVTFPAVIKSGSQAKLCVSIMKLTESVLLTIDLVHENQNKTLLQVETVNELHRCHDFQAPMLDSVQEVKVMAQGKNTLVTETRKVKFISVQPLTIIGMDKRIYNPGQTVHFRIFTMDTDFKPIEEKYKIVAVQDNRGNRINQWINATATHGKIVQLSHVLNPEAPVGFYELSVETDKATFKEQFQVKQYVLPKFEVIIKHPETVRANEDLTLAVCGRYTHGRPILGKVEMSLCCPKPYYASPYNSRFCIDKLAVLNDTGCVSQLFSIFEIIKHRAPEYVSSLEFTASVTEEGTEISLIRSSSVPLSYTIGRVIFVDEPAYIKDGHIVKGKVKVELSDGTPVTNSKVTVFANNFIRTSTFPLTTDINGMANFTIYLLSFQMTTCTISASASPDSLFGFMFNFENSQKTVQLQDQSTAKTSQLTIKALPEPLKCEVEISVTVQYTFAGETMKSDSVTIVYLIVSRGEIIHHGHNKVTVSDSDGVVEGEVAFRVHVHPKMAPKMEILTYCVLPSETVLSTSKTFQTEKCLENKVSLQFSPATAVPGEANTIQLSAQPGSLCGLTGVDQSVNILEKNKHLNVDKIFSMLPHRFFSYEIEDPVECFKIRFKRSTMPSIYPPIYPSTSGNTLDSVYESFKNMGLKVATNLIVRTPPCVKLRDVFYQRVFGDYHPMRFPGSVYPHVYAQLPGVGAGLGAGGVGGVGPGQPFAGGVGLPGGAGGGVAGYGPGVYGPGGYGPGDYGPGGYGPGGYVPGVLNVVAPPIETIRTFFPETWIWDLVEVGDSGSTQVPVKVPDTITTWETDAFCLSSKGLGLAPPAQLTVFQPFFLELSLPYSIIRGEIFELKATVFNYLSKCIMVKVTPAPSSDFTLKASSDDDQYSSCLCANGRKTFKWILTPSVLGVLNITVSAEAEQSQTVCDNEIVSVPERGRIDTVTQSLRVNAEGIEKTESHSWLLCPKGQNLLAEVELAFPKNVIEGSARSTVSVLGDILGRALQNLHGLLRMPYGCGEQNIAVLSPNIYILQYLENTQQLTSAIRERAIGFLKNGYQRQLNYENSEDGSYTTFGHGEGNTWLTAFVLRTFGKAQRYIFIDPQKIQTSKQWLMRHQQTGGCFESKGKLFNNRMKGGVSDSVTISAYITASLLELNTSITDPVVSKSLMCLKRFAGHNNNTYTTALLAYTFSLAGERSFRDYLLRKLSDIGISEGSQLHWSQSGSVDDSGSLSVEISSYVLLAVLTSDSVTTVELGYANRIVSWLVKQQNAYGGFSSTQDTVVALQALSLYATKVFSSDGFSTVTVQSAGDSHNFDVNQDNKLLYQEKKLTNVPGKYSIEVKGSACVSVQISLFYNIPTPSIPNTFNISAKTEGVCEKSNGQILDVMLNIEYSGSQPSTNMVIVNVKLLSGFIAETLSLHWLKTAELVSRVESKDDHVIMYLQEVQHNRPVFYTLRIKQIVEVENLKPAVIQVYDYYQTSDRFEKEYFNHCLNS
ncbi:alpha-2-macroglobulin isoform X2 [Paramisgurnus dabryanus]|uniref:alpha-2-macroglobulin isoform X2 n=1 Tax=Paramisgurnus dabryanus TaxID=90735 RepID=UPI0031F40587